MQQPWAWAILHAGKDVENRRWSTPFRGEFALHASRIGRKRAALPRGIKAPPLADLPGGAIVGLAEVVDVVRRSDSRWFEGPYGFVLGNVRPLPQPVPCKGNLYFWGVPPDVALAVRRQFDRPTLSVPGLADPSMRHFVAYHNERRMGRLWAAGRPFEIWTNKPVAPLLGQTIWVIVGLGNRQFALASVFRVDAIGNRAQADFRHFARGVGRLFEPALPLHHLDWFPRFAARLGRFGFGLTEIKQRDEIACLSALAQ